MNKRTTRGDRIFQWCINIIAILICVVTVYPLIYVVSASFSEPIKLMSGDVVLWPVGLNVNSYRRVFASADIINGYKNTIIYATSGTLLNLVLTIFAAYPLSMPDMKGKNFVTFMITFTMFFSGGLIPKYLLMNTLKLVGATKGYIMRPFLATAAKQGLWAGLVASLLFVGSLASLSGAMPEIIATAELIKIAIMVGTMILTGLVISLLFTTFAVGKFVNMKSNKIYLY